MNTREVGQISEYKFLITALELNWQVAIPAGSSTLHQYDMLLYIGGQWQKVQIKSTGQPRKKTGRSRGREFIAIDLRRGFRTRTNKPRDRYYGSDAFDYLGAVYQDMVWLIPKGAVGTTSINLLSEKYRQYRIK